MLALPKILVDYNIISQRMILKKKELHNNYVLLCYVKGNNLVATGTKKVLCVYMCVCKYVCMCEPENSCMCSLLFDVSLSICDHVCLCVCVSLYIYVYIYV